MIAKEAAAAPDDQLPQHSPIYGEVAHHYRAATAKPYETSYAVTYVVIWDGHRWVDSDSSEGIQVRNTILRRGMKTV
jgi:hypothetical protein